MSLRQCNFGGWCSQWTLTRVAPPANTPSISPINHGMSYGLSYADGHVDPYHPLNASAAAKSEYNSQQDAFSPSPVPPQSNPE